MREPDIATEKLPGVQLGEKLRGAWDTFVDRHPEVVKTAQTFSAEDARLESKFVELWTKEMLRVLGGPVCMEGVALRPNTVFKSPLNAGLWHAWQHATGDPDDSSQSFIREGASLGMASRIPSSNSIPGGRPQRH